MPIIVIKAPISHKDPTRSQKITWPNSDDAKTFTAVFVTVPTKVPAVLSARTYNEIIAPFKLNMRPAKTARIIHSTIIGMSILAIPGTVNGAAELSPAISTAP
mmetsp:Transcript_21428/g.34456  ORF Transcript_21428/g.34456 Transcript_21428/m.34456 type:complete len:103 (+) Transcript_21428:1038-1346(+)